MKRSLRNKTGKKLKVAQGVGRAFRYYNCAKLFGWTIDEIADAPADILNEMLTVHEAITDEQDRIGKENKTKQNRTSGKGRRR